MSYYDNTGVVTLAILYVSEEASCVTRPPLLQSNSDRFGCTMYSVAYHSLWHFTFCHITSIFLHNAIHTYLPLLDMQET